MDRDSSRMVLAQRQDLWEHSDGESLWRSFKRKDWEEICEIRQVVLGLMPMRHTPERGVYETGYLKMESYCEDDCALTDTEIWWWDAVDATNAERLFRKIVDKVTRNTQCMILDAREDDRVVYEGEEQISEYFGDLTLRA